MIPISSDDLIDIETPFRVSAGPGAGKTYWLVKHIKNVLKKSKRLEKVRKIACITYTNVASETVISRLGDTAERVEVSTIHSFLFAHVIKPYLLLLQEEFGLNASKVEGHDDTVLSNYGFLNEWKTATGQLRIREDNLVIAAFKKMRWKFENNDLVVRPDYPQRVGDYSIKTSSYKTYKDLAWKEGVIHHDDVLFFSLNLIRKYPFITEVLRAKFPYFFIDEFQDTNPIQIEILKAIAEKETVVGIIGDDAQSIYGFQGAEYHQFRSFSITGIIDYQISNNRRSTGAILSLMGIVRPTLIQNNIRSISGSIPKILVGGMNSAIEKAMQLAESTNVYTLSRDNITSNVMKRHLDGSSYDDSLIDKLLIVDPPTLSNKYRSKEVIAHLKSVELAKQKRFKDAIKELVNLYPRAYDKTIKRKLALAKIALLLKNYNDFSNKSFYDFYLFLKTNGSNISDMRNGAPKTFYESHTYTQLALCVKINEDTSLHRTIHKAKGDEFDSVMLILKDENSLDFILKPDLNDEEQRVNYVAISRARDHLFISVPNLGDISRTLLSEHLEIIDL